MSKIYNGSVSDNILHDKIAKCEQQIAGLQLSWAGCSQQLKDACKDLDETEDERDKLREQVKLLRDALSNSRHQCESLRVWNGMGWTYQPFHVKRIWDTCEKALVDTEPKP